ncbi:tRNA (adenosine(37)-N6)-dimethylallyltransferase MiaA [Rhodoferax sp. TBRC 17660]|uniref:tRNA dimethylallyltransferase n=1 Tax=Rhodoferax potami TaxID=3068338 RepID=A0ABU3KJ00_9BURK|nr:tRNA (adenosine(37)-N6)-dimethylallyltransferase MiaA [Rhodoferax sp. TBRC 17660]MDT7517750.1 tRNA (adenosine(37)-N6)-dimethylallyltransferase MiaA [Rhodoferax sp. TBRC 17660]
MSNPLPFYLCLAGPTAAGKTAAALAIAAEHPAEIISVDSALVYQGMDIGTAKPEAHELAAVPHHLINIRDPLHTYSAAEFVKDAKTLITDISARGKLPLLVGGTMLYFKALFDGLDDMPAASPEIRAALEAEAAALGWPAMHAQLAAVDPVTAARLAPADSQRIQRALEVYRVSGQPLSYFHAQQDAIKKEAARADITGASTLFSLEPADRTWLHGRIAQRFDLMLQGGFLDEVKTLMARGDLHPDLPSMRCVGYRQAWEALTGVSPMAELRDKGIFATRQLAKRQITWLRSMPRRQVIACDQSGAQETLLHAVRTTLQQRAKP